MATAKDLRLQQGDIIRIGTARYTENVHLIKDSYGRNKVSRGLIVQDLDMESGPRAEVVSSNWDDATKVRYLDDENKDPLFPNIKTRKAGSEWYIWYGYVGFTLLERAIEPQPV